MSERSKIMKQSMDNIEQINEKFLKKIETLENENAKMTAVLKELHLDNNEKENALEEATKLLSKLDDENKQLRNEYERTLDCYNKIVEEIRESKKIIQEKNKKIEQMDLIKKQNQRMNNEIESLKNENAELKNIFNEKLNNLSELEKENKGNFSLINTLKNNSAINEKVREDHERLIQEYELKIDELNQLVEAKDEKLKNLIQINHEYNEGVKISVDEITKQATNTIKQFYNNLNILEETNINSNKDSLNFSFVEKKDQNDLFSLSEIQTIFKENKINQHISQQDIFSRKFNQNSFQCEILKSEIFSHILRELNQHKYFSTQVNKIDNNIKVYDEITNFSKLLITIDKLFLRNEKAEKLIIFFNEKICDLKREKEELKDKINILEKSLEHSQNALISVENQSKQNVSRIQNMLINSENQNIDLKIIENIIDDLNNKFKESENLLKAKIILLKEEIESLKSNKVGKKEEINEKIEKDLREKENRIKSLIKELENKDKSILSSNEENKNYLNQIKNQKNKIQNLESELEEKSKQNIQYMNSSQYNINDSFNEKNYRSKKEENNKMKDEIQRLKSEIASLIKINQELIDSSEENSRKFDFLKVQGSNFIEYICKNKEKVNKMISDDSLSESISKSNRVISQINNAGTDERIIELKKTLKTSIFNEMKKFFLSYYAEIENATLRINEVMSKFTQAENDFNAENKEKKIKKSQVKEILSSSIKLMSVLSTFFAKYNKDIYFYTSNLKKIFDFVEKTCFEINFDVSPIKKLKTERISNLKINKTVIKEVAQIAKILKKLNLTSIEKIYENKPLTQVIDEFKIQCQVLKNALNKSKLEYENESSDKDEFVNMRSHEKRVSDTNLKESYKIVNEKIIKLKKLEFDLNLFTEATKHFYFVLHVILKKTFGRDYIEQKAWKRDNFEENVYLQVDYFEITYNLFEEILNFKENEIDSNSTFIRKILLRMIKDQGFLICSS